jgi:hypothetical protein
MPKLSSKDTKSICAGPFHLPDHTTQLSGCGRPLLANLSAVPTFIFNGKPNGHFAFRRGPRFPDSLPW